MKFKFSLEKVLRQRELQESLAQKDFAEAQNQLNDEIAKLQNMIQIKEDSIRERNQLVQNTQTWGVSVQQINQFLLGQDLRIKQQNQRLSEFEKVVEAKREILRKASVEVKIIEKLKEKKLEEFKREFERKEQNELDELTALRFSRNENPLKGSHEDGI
jgi:flagellar protein FliJ